MGTDTPKPGLALALPDPTTVPSLPFPEPAIAADALDVPAPRTFAPSPLPPAPDLYRGWSAATSERSGPMQSIPLPLDAHLGELLDRDEPTEPTPPTAIPGAGFDGLFAGDDDEDEEDDAASAPVPSAEGATPATGAVDPDAETTAQTAATTSGASALAMASSAARATAAGQSSRRSILRVSESTAATPEVAADPWAYAAVGLVTGFVLGALSSWWVLAP